LEQATALLVIIFKQITCQRNFIVESMPTCWLNTAAMPVRPPLTQRQFPILLNSIRVCELQYRYRINV
jgi:hypothetical protein